MLNCATTVSYSEQGVTMTDARSGKYFFFHMLASFLPLLISVNMYLLTTYQYEIGMAYGMSPCRDRDTPTGQRRLLN